MSAEQDSEPAFFGEFTLHDVAGSTKLFRLHNPIRPELWGAKAFDGIPIIPCDNFVTDLTSSGWARGLYPATLGKRAAVIHDWGYRAHKVSYDELMLNMTPWFEHVSMCQKARVSYVKWLRALSRSEWDDLYVQLCVLDGVGPCRRAAARAVLAVMGFFTWRFPPRKHTEAFRLAVSRGETFHAAV